MYMHTQMYISVHFDTIYHGYEESSPAYRHAVTLWSEIFWCLSRALSLAICLSLYLSLSLSRSLSLSLSLYIYIYICIYIYVYIYIHLSQEQVDGFVRELLFAQRLCEHFL